MRKVYRSYLFAYAAATVALIAAPALAQPTGNTVTNEVKSPRDVGSGKAPEAPQPDGFITGVPDLPSVATSTPSSTAQNARGKWEVSEYDALQDQSSGNRRAGQIMAGPGDGAAGPLTATSNTTIQSPPQTQAQYNPKELQIQSPRDPASGQSTGAAQEARTENPPTGIYASNPGGGLLGVNDGQSGGSNGTGAGNVGQFAESGKKAEEMIVGNPEVGTGTVREGGTNDTTHRTKKPRRDRNGTRGKRQHKP